MRSIRFLLIGLTMTAVASSPGQASFSTSVFNAIASKESDKNIILSPLSIQSCLALTYLGAEGNTAAELQRALQLSGASKEAVSENFSKVLSKTKGSENKLKIANRIYVDHRFALSPSFNEFASKHFNSAAENVKFSDNTITAKHINDWVEQQTDEKIKNLISADSLSTNTASVLVNAIYFQADWLNTFDTSQTQLSMFKARTGPVEIMMMRQEDNFRYGELHELNATALELPYEGTTITMLIILPKQEQGLFSLESKLKGINLSKLSESLSEEKVRIALPKFKIEYDISLQPVLEELGIKQMFTRQADFSSLLDSSSPPLRVSQVKHKAYVELNEKGTTAAGATYAKVTLESLFINEIIYDFVVDHPFYFAIKDNETTYFAGHVTIF